MQSNCQNTKTFRHSNVGIKNSVMHCWHCCHVFLFRNIYKWSRPRRLGLCSLMVLASTSAFWPCLTLLVTLVITEVTAVLPSSSLLYQSVVHMHQLQPSYFPVVIKLIKNAPIGHRQGRRHFYLVVIMFLFKSTSIPISHFIHICSCTSAFYQHPVISVLGCFAKCSFLRYALHRVPI